MTALLCMPMPAKWAEALADPAQLGQLAANAGVLLGGIAALATLTLVAIRTYNNQVDQQFDAIFNDFWKSDKAALARDLVTYDDQYQKVRAALRHMAHEDRETEAYDEHMRGDIEAINYFCAQIARVDILGSKRLSKRRKAMFDRVFGYWVAEIKRRDALNAYYRRYWTPPIGVQKANTPCPIWGNSGGS
ncbi:MAG: hypothetical protein E2598_06080 [Sphingobium sp.]|nr:hypothetical protein [Sphingobium sp.]